jgi:hypothetical protein
VHFIREERCAYGSAADDPRSRERDQRWAAHVEVLAAENLSHQSGALVGPVHTYAPPKERLRPPAPSWGNGSELAARSRNALIQAG